MAPELRKAYIDGEDLADEKYDVYKADIWALGMTLVDLATMSIGDAKTNKEKLESIRKRYGEKLRDLIADMLEIDFRKRKNVKELLHVFKEEKILNEVKIRNYHFVLIIFKNRKSQKKKLCLTSTLKGSREAMWPLIFSIFSKTRQ